MQFVVGSRRHLCCKLSNSSSSLSIRFRNIPDPNSPFWSDYPSLHSLSLTGMDYCRQLQSCYLPCRWSAEIGDGKGASIPSKASSQSFYLGTWSSFRTSTLSICLCMR